MSEAVGASKHKDEARRPRRHRKRQKLDRKCDTGDIDPVVFTVTQYCPEPKPGPERLTEVDLVIDQLAPNGEGLAQHQEHPVLVPFTAPGDKVLARIYRTLPSHSLCDLVKVIEPSAERDDLLVRCKYFGSCSGCQLQHLPYPTQLKHKQAVIEQALARFDLKATVEATHGSPLTYAYRTKLTPHFDCPRGGFTDGMVPNIGFDAKGRRQTIDIEECPIATDAVNKGLAIARKKVLAELSSFRRGATLLLRDSQGTACVTDSKTTILEKVGKYEFEFPAGSFFQNNNSVLDNLTTYVREQLCGDHLVDAYCGVGLFSITCAEGFSSVIGVEISKDSVDFARRNAKRNGIANSTFIAGTAEKIFDGIAFDGSKSSVIIDPPRKGCDELFLAQLLAFRPKRIVYVSCNVHTQARDIAHLRAKHAGYRLKSIVGFDLFPQTAHVEGVAVLEDES